VLSISRYPNRPLFSVIRNLAVAGRIQPCSTQEFALTFKAGLRNPLLVLKSSDTG